MDRVINSGLLLHPLNWLIVWVVLIGATMAYSFIHDNAHAAPLAE